MQWDEERRRWVVRWREAGRQRIRRFENRDDAVLWESLVRRRRVLGELAVERLGGQVTLEEWVTTRYIPEHQAHLAPNTRRWQGELWDNHLEALGPMRLREITPGVIRQWQAQRDRDGAGRVALRRALQLLGSMLQHAVESDEIPSNPVRAVKPLPKARTRTATALSPLQVEQIRAAMKHPRHRLLVSLMAYGGLRPAEAYVLEGERVMQRTMVIDSAGDGSGGVKATKTNATRAVDLFPSLREDLESMAPARGFVFGAPMNKGQWANFRFKVWKPAVEAATGTYVPPYDLRHSAASLWLAEHHSVHYVASQLGHDASETLSRYGHLIAEFRGAKIDAQAEIDKARKQVWGTPIPTREDVRT